MAQGINQEGPGSWYWEFTEQYILRVRDAGWTANTIVPCGRKLVSLAYLSPPRKRCSALRVILFLHTLGLVRIYAVYRRYNCGARIILLHLLSFPITSKTVMSSHSHCSHQ